MLKLFNSLTKQLEEFKPIHPLQVGMYSCGPTVYQFAHIGNFRSYLTSDILVRILMYNGYDVNFVMNITDVGHMTQDQVEGGDSGEDKIEKTARREGKSAWEVAQFYTDAFLEDYNALHLRQPTMLCKATDHIKEQIALIQGIEANGFAYETSDGIYFDTSLLPDYGKMSSFEEAKEAENVARVAANEEKKNPRDFALWKFSGVHDRSASVKGSGETRQMEWDSPWGKGFPGWHIECSAMSMKYLGETFDIHTGGADHKEIHHPNEIAQAQAVTHSLLAKYWIHTAFMLVAGQKMSKSLENTYTLYDLKKEGYDPLSLRYLYLQTHYHQEMNFTFPALDAAQNALKKLRFEVAKWENPLGEVGKPGDNCPEYEKRFFEAINDDLNMPKALAVVWEMVKSDNPTHAKAKSLFKMDTVLGLDLEEASLQIKQEHWVIPGHIQALVDERNALRKQKRFNAADKIRAEINKLGYDIEDTKKGVKVKKR